MTEILSTLSLDVFGDRRGDFTVGADVLAESLPQSVLESLESAWGALERAARSPVREISFVDSARVAPADDNLDRSLSRWEDDGGYIPDTVLADTGA